MPDNINHSFVVKVALRKSLGLIKGPRRQISDADEDVIVLKLLEQLDIAGYEIVKKPGNAGFTLDTLGGDGSIARCCRLAGAPAEPDGQSSGIVIMRTADRRKRRANIARYKRTRKGKAANKRYRQSAKDKATAARYRQTAKGKARDARYRRSKKGKVARARAQARYRAKLRAMTRRLRSRRRLKRSRSRRQS